MAVGGQTGQYVVLKYPLLFEKEDDHGVISVDMPRDHRVFLVDSQQGAVCLWAEVPLEVDELETYHFRVYATGQPYESANLAHVGSTQIGSPAGARVWHVFREFEPPKGSSPAAAVPDKKKEK